MPIFDEPDILDVLKNFYNSLKEMDLVLFICKKGFIYFPIEMDSDDINRFELTITALINTLSEHINEIPERIVIESENYNLAIVTSKKGILLAQTKKSVKLGMLFLEQSESFKKLITITERNSYDDLVFLSKDEILDSISQLLKLYDSSDSKKKV